MESCDNQFQNLDSSVYTFHIQETNGALPSSPLELINDDKSIGNRTSFTHNPLLEMCLDIMKMDDLQESECGKGMDNRTLKVVNAEYTSSANFEDIGTTGSSHIELTGITSGNGTYPNEWEVQPLEITKSYLDLQEEAFAVHGLDMSLPIECDLCNIEFDDLTNFDAHMKEHVETKLYMCQFCSKTYKSWENLIAHRKVCHNGQFISCDNCSRRKIHYNLGPISYPVGDFPVGCEECNAGFTTNKELNRHYRQHQTEKKTVKMLENMLKEPRETAEKTEVNNSSDNEDQDGKSECFFMCKTCTEEIPMETYLAHKKLHPNICVFYKCPYCKRVFYTHSRFISHKDAHGIKEYKCKKCPQIFKNKLYWDIHKLSHLISKKYKCFNCQLEFDAARELSNHITEVHIPHPERKLTCDICTLHFPVERFMKHYLHCLTELKSLQGTIKKKGNSTCSGCNRVFSNAKTLIRHKKVHSFVKDPHLCEVCGMTITNLGAFIAHIRSHGKEYNKKEVEPNEISEKNVIYPKESTIKIKSFICEFCGNSFKNNRLLKLHVQRHHITIKPFDCTICSMAFYTGEQLTVHMRHHTGERPYQCAVCKKSFASSGVLYTHRRLHNSTKQHTCPVCDKNFLWRSAYHNHMRSHSVTRPFKCNECPKSFLFKHRLTAHKKTHKKERFFVLSHLCTDCGQSFNSASELQNHHENNCYLSMITFMPSSDAVNKEESLIF